MAFKNLTEWPPLGEFPVLCISEARDKPHWVKGIYFANANHGGSLIAAIYPEEGFFGELTWVGQGEPHNWHLFNPETCRSE